VKEKTAYGQAGTRHGVNAIVAYTNSAFKN